MPADFDIIIVGAGPAGMSAAIESARHGASVCVLDEQPRAGGQIYRNIENTSHSQAKVLGKDYLAGRSLVEKLALARVDHRAAVIVWKIDQDGSVTYTGGGRAQQIRGRHIILASGAIERPVPVPGWTLPGVITAGAAQIMMKSDGIVAHDAVLVGSGPLLYLVATQLLAAGAPPKALIETQTRQNLVAAVPHVSGALKDWKQLARGLRFLVALKAANVPRYRGASDIIIAGEDCAQAVQFRAGGKHHQIDTDLVLMHQGVVPNTQISRSLGLEHRYDDTQRCFHPVTDELGQSSHPLFSIAGDGAGIGGAKAAATGGRISALNALASIGKIDESASQKIIPALLKARRSQLSIRAFLDILYSPPESLFLPADDTIICRCEEIRAGDVRRYVSLGCTGPNQTKVFGRCGMGPCQGRNCGLTVTEILAAENKETQDAVGSFRIRSPLKPVTLSELASLANITHEDTIESSNTSTQRLE